MQAQDIFVKVLINCYNLIVSIIFIVFQPIPTYTLYKLILLLGILQHIGHFTASKIIAIIFGSTIVHITQLVYELIYLLHLVCSSIITVFQGVGVGIDARGQAVEQHAIQGWLGFLQGTGVKTQHVETVLQECRSNGAVRGQVQKGVGGCRSYLSFFEGGLNLLLLLLGLGQR